MSWEDNVDRFIPEICVIANKDTGKLEIVNEDMLKTEADRLQGMSPGDTFRVAIYCLVDTPQFKKKGHIQ